MSTVYKTPQGRWRGQYTDPDGRRRSKTFRTRADAKRWADSMERSIDDGRWVSPEDLTLADWIPEFLAAYRSHAAEATQESYRHSLDRLRLHAADLLARPIQSIRQPDVQRAVNTLADHCHARTVEITLTLVRMALKKAVALQMLATDPSAGVKVPPPQKSHGGRLIDTGSMRWLLEHLRQPGNIRSQATRDALLLIALTGMRSQEARSLRCEDIRPDGVMIDSVLDRHGVRKPPKTVASRRLVPVTDELREMLERRVSESVNGLIFEQPDGRLIGPTVMARYLRRLTSGQISPHDLRHTFVTNAVRAGANLKALSAITGDNVDTLLKVYTHVSMEDKQAVLELAQPRETLIVFPTGTD